MSTKQMCVCVVINEAFSEINSQAVVGQGINLGGRELGPGHTRKSFKMQYLVSPSV